MCNPIPIKIKTKKIVRRIKINKKTHKTIYKKYRFFGTDLWGILGKSFRDNKIVFKIARITYQTLMNRLKTTEGRTEEVKKVLDRFPNLSKNKFSRRKTYDVDLESEQRMSSHGRRPYSAGGAARILRRKLVLFYGGGRLRIPTFRIYAKFTDSRNREDQLTNLRRRLSTGYSIMSILETRADIFFFRIGFFGTIYESRLYCFFKRARIKNYSKPLLPWSRIQALEICFVIYYRKLQQLFLINLMKNKIMIPAWINLSITFMRAFILYYPVRVGYPGANMTGAPIKVFQLGF